MLSVECDLPVGGHLREFEQTLAYKAYANTPEVTQNVSGILSPKVLLLKCRGRTLCCRKVFSRTSNGSLVGVHAAAGLYEEARVSHARQHRLLWRCLTQHPDQDLLLLCIAVMCLHMS